MARDTRMRRATDAPVAETHALQKGGPTGAPCARGGEGAERSATAQSGAVTCMFKPFSEADLLEAVRLALAVQRNRS